MDYLDAVKLEFRDQPEIYDEFLAIMGRFKTKQMLPPDVIVEVARLFRGRNSLVLRFNRFLPEGYKIGLSDIERMEQEYQAKEAASRPLIRSGRKYRATCVLQPVALYSVFCLVVIHQPGHTSAIPPFSSRHLYAIGILGLVIAGVFPHCESCFS